MRSPYLTIGVICIIAAVMAVGIKGCMKARDPVTGEETWVLDPNAAATAEQAVETGGLMATALGIVIPGAAGVGSLLLGILGAWLKMKKPLAEATNRAELSNAAGRAISDAIELWKEVKPDSWLELKAELTKAIGPDAENIIRGWRGLPAKQ